MNEHGDGMFDVGCLLLRLRLSVKNRPREGGFNPIEGG